MKTKSYRLHFVLLIVVCAALLCSAYVVVPGRGNEFTPPTPPKPKKLPDAVQRTVGELFPGAQIEDIGLDRRIMQFYEVAVIKDGKKVEMTLMPDGTLLEMETQVDPLQVPPGVQNAIPDLTRNATLKEVEQVKIIAELKAVPLESPRVVYEAELILPNGERGVRLKSDGKPVDGDGPDNEEN